MAMAVKDFDRSSAAEPVDRLTHGTRSRLEDLVADSGAGDDLVWLVPGTRLWPAGYGRSSPPQSGPGAPGLESLFAEVDKLQRVRKLELLADLFADVSDKQVGAWRARASKEYPANLARMKPPMRLTLLAALCHVRHTEITDSLVELFIQLDGRGRARQPGQ
ncbi:hypothetical protein ACIBG0_20975 [Nocardia sp. NPDC050630]|uniref:hypothetical protein n=1 Tax=Nocardia sp. NPDC050630 TaxID=3364321 RepID=UPI00378B17B9